MKRNDPVKYWSKKVARAFNGKNIKVKFRNVLSEACKDLSYKFPYSRWANWYSKSPSGKMRMSDAYWLLTGEDIGKNA